MKDLFGNIMPIQIEKDEWWFNGRIIQKQNHPNLPKWISFADNNSPFVEIHSSKKEAVKFAMENPCKKPKCLPIEYL
jgi:hypothetical protein